MPTLRAQGYSIPSSPPGSLITVEDRGEVWENAHHTIFNSHLGQLMRGLGLQEEGGWGIVRGEVGRCLDGEGGEGEGLGRFLGRERVEYKCFIRMKMEGLYRDVSTLPPPSAELIFLLFCFCSGVGGLKGG